MIPTWAWYLWPLTLTALFVWALALRAQLRELRWARRKNRQADERLARVDEDACWRTFLWEARMRQLEQRVDRVLADNDIPETLLRAVK